MSLHLLSHRDTARRYLFDPVFVHGLVGPELDDTFFCPNCHTNGSARIAAPSVRPDQRQ